MRIALVLAALLLAGCGGEARETVEISGVIMAGPTPGPCLVNQPCSRPAAEVELVLTGPDGKRFEATSDAKGQYAIDVEPDTYRVRAANYPSPAVIQPATVTVAADTTLNLAIDTGVR